MKKIKFQIKGMHCQSCVTLIEDRLKNLGVDNAKVNLDSQKAVVIFNEQKIPENQIYETIKNSGDYQIEELKEEVAEQPLQSLPVTAVNSLQPPAFISSPSKTLFLFGFLTSFSILSLLLNIFFVITLYNSSISKANTTTTKTTAAQAQNLPSGSQPTPSQRTNPIQTFNITKDNHVRGNFNAQITLVEFSDFECPFCGRFYPTLKKVLDDYPNQVRLVYKHLPLNNIHPNAQKAAEASECASEQEKFWEYHDKLFDNQASGYSVDKFKQWASDLGLNSNQFNNCLVSGKYTTKVQTDYQEGTTKGVTGTPGSFVNGQLVSGAVPYESLKQIIDNTLTQ